MGFEYLTNVPLEQARREYLELLEHQGFEPQTQVIPVYESCGRVTAEAVYAISVRRIIPPVPWMVWRFVPEIPLVPPKPRR